MQWGGAQSCRNFISHALLIPKGDLTPSERRRGGVDGGTGVEGRWGEGTGGGEREEAVVGI